MSEVLFRESASAPLHRLSEIDDLTLQRLIDRFPLDPAKQSGQSSEHLLKVIAIHAEDTERKKGRKKTDRQPDLRELAKQIIDKGFQQASKLCHPDRVGGAERIQQLLGEAKEELYKACDKLSVGVPDDALIISDDSEDSYTGNYAYSAKITDNDIPF